MLVDLHIWEKKKMARFHWKLHINGRYAYTNRGGPILAHRFTMNAGKGTVVDHINGNGLDNRLQNLRFATQAQNMMNQKPKKRLGYKGIYFHRGMWVSMMKFQGRRYYLGRFKEQKRAAMAYDRAALAVAGEHSYLNFEHLRGTYKPKMPTECKPRKS